MRTNEWGTPFQCRCDLHELHSASAFSPCKSEERVVGIPTYYFSLQRAQEVICVYLSGVLGITKDRIEGVPET